MTIAYDEGLGFDGWKRGGKVDEQVLQKKYQMYTLNFKHSPNSFHFFSRTIISCIPRLISPPI